MAIAGYLRGDDDPFPAALDRVEDAAPAELVETLRLVPDRWLETVRYREDLELLAGALATADIDPGT